MISINISVPLNKAFNIYSVYSAVPLCSHLFGNKHVLLKGSAQRNPRGCKNSLLYSCRGTSEIHFFPDLVKR